MTEPEPAANMRPTTLCNGICLTGYDVGVPDPQIAYPHPDCEEHGEPEEPPEWEPPECAQCGQTTGLVILGGRPWCSRHRSRP